MIRDPWPVLLVAGLMVVGLLACPGAYGFHGDEMYFVVAGQHPAFGYVDQPPLTPLLSAASVALLGVSPTAVRVLPALEMGLVVVLVALIAGTSAGRGGRRSWPRSRPPLSGYLGRGPSRHHDRPRPAGLGDHPVAAGEAPRAAATGASGSWWA